MRSQVSNTKFHTQFVHKNFFNVKNNVLHTREAFLSKANSDKTRPITEAYILTSYEIDNQQPL
jgi:hypothetical protein